MSAVSISVSRRASERIAAIALVVLCASVAQAQQNAGPRVTAQAVQPAQPTPVVTVNQEALFVDSQFGRRIQSELERDRAALAAENRRIESELIEEEQSLTDRRAEMESEAFSKLADAFDTKVQRIRSEQDLKARQLQEQLDAARQRFLSVVGPVLTDILREMGASVLIDNQAVLISVQGIDITDEAIAAINERLGDGRDKGLTVPTARPEGEQTDGSNE